MICDYAMTGRNPHLSTTQFIAGGHANHTIDMIYKVMSMGGCLDAPDLIPAGGCHNNWCADIYVNRG